MNECVNEEKESRQEVAPLACNMDGYCPGDLAGRAFQRGLLSLGMGGGWDLARKGWGTSFLIFSSLKGPEGPQQTLPLQLPGH